MAVDDRQALWNAREAYFVAFGNEGPCPHAVSANDLARALLAAVQRGEPIPRDFDWWAGLPDGAVA